jgi:hypothetical protein
VDPPEIVTDLVMPHRVELVAGAKQLAGGRLSRPDPSDQGSGRTKLLHLWIHHQFLASGKLDTPARKVERVADVSDQRPDQIAAPAPAGDRVRNRLLSSRWDPRDDRPSGPPKRRGKAILEQKNGGLGSAFIEHLEIHAHPRSRKSPACGEASSYGQFVLAPANESRRQGSEDDQTHGHHVQVLGAEESSSDPQQQGSSDDGQPSAREHVYLFTGTGTSSSNSVRTVSAERALMAASAETMIR